MSGEKSENSNWIIYSLIAIFIIGLILGLLLYFFYFKKKDLKQLEENSKDKDGKVNEQSYFKNIVQDLVQKEGFREEMIETLTLTDSEKKLYSDLGKILCGKQWKEKTPIINTFRYERNIGENNLLYLAFSIFYSDISEDLKKDVISSIVLADERFKKFIKYKIIENNGESSIKFYEDMIEIFVKKDDIITITEFRYRIYDFFDSFTSKDKFIKLLEKTDEYQRSMRQVQNNEMRENVDVSETTQEKNNEMRENVNVSETTQETDNDFAWKNIESFKQEIKSKVKLNLCRDNDPDKVPEKNYLEKVIQNFSSKEKLDEIFESIIQNEIKDKVNFCPIEKLENINFDILIASLDKDYVDIRDIFFSVFIIKNYENIKEIKDGDIIGKDEKIIKSEFIDILITRYYRNWGDKQFIQNNFQDICIEHNGNFYIDKQGNKIMITALPLEVENIIRIEINDEEKLKEISNGKNQMIIETKFVNVEMTGISKIYLDDQLNRGNLVISNNIEKAKFYFN